MWGVYRPQPLHRTSLHSIRSDLVSDVYLRFSEGEPRVRLTPQRTRQAGGEVSDKQKYANVLRCSLTTSFSEATAACERVFTCFFVHLSMEWLRPPPLTTSDLQESVWCVCGKGFEQQLFILLWRKRFKQHGVHFEGLWADDLNGLTFGATCSVMNVQVCLF